MTRAFARDVVVVGGCGHVGLPLAILLADRGLRVSAFDVDAEAVARVASGSMPFDEPGAGPLLERGLASGRLEVTTDPACVSGAEHVVIVIGTPVDEHLNPDPETVPRAVEALADRLRDGQLLVLRSTIYPGVTRLVEQVVARSGRRIDVCFCPERIAEGKAIDELSSLPQIVAARDERVTARAERLFGVIAHDLVRTTPEEAELAKLFTNTWRYIKFAAANQLFTIANDFGVDFERVRAAITHDYPRAADMPGAGFAAGPCLFKDTMQLAAFNNNQFTLGHASMLVNEGLPLYLVSRLERRHDLSQMTVGILGMAFKAESDDARSSLAYKLKRILRYKAREVLCADPYVRTDKDLVAEDEVVRRADLVVIGAPHRRYATLPLRQPVVDVWNVRNGGVLV